jgi:uncharacterized membrane protein YgaE (UPF0421/DUF939 family)
MSTKVAEIKAQATIDNAKDTAAEVSAIAANKVEDVKNTVHQQTAAAYNKAYELQRHAHQQVDKAYDTAAEKTYEFSNAAK